MIAGRIILTGIIAVFGICADAQSETDYARLRSQMLERQIRARGGKG